MSIVKYGVGKIKSEIVQKTDEKTGRKVVSSKEITPKKKSSKGN